MEVISCGKTDIGQKRKTNQDSILINHGHQIYCVADGMGGHNGGDIASQMSVREMQDFLEQQPLMSHEEIMQYAVKHINQKIFLHAQSDLKLKGMGTTITSIHLADNKAVIGNVGDSRTYVIGNHKIYQLTRDHSLVQEKLNIGIYDREGALRDPQKNVLIRSVGFEEDVDVDVYMYKINRYDIFLLCSDGLHGKVSDEDIIYLVNREIPEPSLAEETQLQSAVDALIQAANDNGGQDNISVILVLCK